MSWLTGLVQGTSTGQGTPTSTVHTRVSRWKGFDTDLSTPLLPWCPVLMDQPWTQSSLAEAHG